MYRKNIYNEGTKYMEQYHRAIYKLMNNDNGLKYIYPLISLIHQTIENELKLLIIEPEYDSKTFHEEKIDNTHDLRLLLNHTKFKTLYDEIEEFEIIFNEFSKLIEYFYNIFGKNTFLNSRYPIEKKRNKITKKNEVDINELYSNWNKYSLLLDEIQIMNNAYINSNIFIYLKDKGNTKEEMEKYEKKIFDIDGLDEEAKQKHINYMRKYINRNKYFDIKYVKNKII